MRVKNDCLELHYCGLIFKSLLPYRTKGVRQSFRLHGLPVSEAPAFAGLF
jgi:hypothetical protein